MPPHATTNFNSHSADSHTISLQPSSKITFTTTVVFILIMHIITLLHTHFVSESTSTNAEIINFSPKHSQTFKSKRKHFLPSIQTSYRNTEITGINKMLRGII